jgi:AcrR family transcriptional regulator
LSSPTPTPRAAVEEAAGIAHSAPDGPSGSVVPVPPRARVPAAERREELIAAAVHEFAHGGLHGTPVERIARRVGVAQPYVFTLFGNKRELFLAALERSFERIAGVFEGAAAEFREGRGPADCEDTLDAMGRAYVELLTSDRDYLMLQHQSYAACDDEVVRARVRHCYAALVGLAQDLSGAEDERIDDFFRHGMVLNVAAALGVEDLSCGGTWVKAELAAARA